jgi:hypothetical protein
LTSSFVLASIEKEGYSMRITYANNAITPTGGMFELPYIYGVSKYELRKALGLD